MRKVVMIVGGGLVGGTTAARLERQGYQVVIVDPRPDLNYLATCCHGLTLKIEPMPVLDPDSARFLLDKYKPYAVIWSAALLRDQIESNPWKGFVTNIAAPTAMLEEAYDCGVKQFVLVSSLGVYDFSADRGDFNEDHPLSPQDLYDRSKLMAEEWFSVRGASCRGMAVTILRLAGTFGFGPQIAGGWMNKQLGSILQDALDSEKAEILIDANQVGTNEYLYAHDAAHGIQCALRREQASPRVYNIGPGCLHDAAAVCSAFSALFPSKRFRLFKSGRLLSNYLSRVHPLNIDRACQELGYSPEFSQLTDALAHYAAISSSLILQKDLSTFPTEHRQHTGMLL